MTPILLTIVLTLNACQLPGDLNTPDTPATTSLSRLSDVLTGRRSRVFGRPFRPQNTITITWDVISGPSSAVTFASDGTVTMGGGQEIIVRSRQTVGTDFFFEVTLPADFGKTQHLPSIGLDTYPIASTGGTLWGIDSIVGKIRVDGQSRTYPAKAGDKISMEATDGVVRYYKNYSGPTSQPFYVSALPVIQPSARFPITMVKPIGGRVGEQWIAGAIRLLDRAPAQ